MANEKRLNRWYFGGISSAAAVGVTHPLDLIKVHLQTQQLPKMSLGETMAHIYAAGGIKINNNIYIKLHLILIRF